MMLHVIIYDWNKRRVNKIQVRSRNTGSLYSYCLIKSAMRDYILFSGMVDYNDLCFEDMDMEEFTFDID